MSLIELKKEIIKKKYHQLITDEFPIYKQLNVLMSQDKEAIEEMNNRILYLREQSNVEESNL